MPGSKIYKDHIVKTIYNKRSHNITRLCSLFSISNVEYYRLLKKDLKGCNLPKDGLKDKIEDVILKYPYYGYRRVTKILQNKGENINHKKVLKIMRLNGLLCKRKRRFTRTTDSNHGLKIYPNLTKDVKLSHTNQLWASDITYIWISKRFYYLAVVLDVHSRMCVGYSLGDSLESQLVLSALKKAVLGREINRGLVHHSDRGVQYASKDYIKLLKDHGISISMSRKANPYDNAYCESFIKTLKYEEVYQKEYQSLDEARESIEHYIEKEYNEKRIHSSIGYMSPMDFEKTLTKQEQHA